MSTGTPQPDEESLHWAIEAVAAEWPTYGYRRITQQLRWQGCTVFYTFDVMNVKRLQCQHFLHALLVHIGVGMSDGDAVCGSSLPV